MKIRLKGNSLRYRLTKSDVHLLATKGQVTETTHFGPASLTCQLLAANTDRLTASFRDNCITVTIPSGWIGNWVESNLVGFSEAMQTDDTGNMLQLSVEKDFTCLDEIEEDQSDNFPNPKANLYEQP